MNIEVTAVVEANENTEKKEESVQTRGTEYVLVVFGEASKLTQGVFGQHYDGGVLRRGG